MQALDAAGDEALAPLAHGGVGGGEAPRGRAVGRARGAREHHVGALPLGRSGGAVLALDDGFYFSDFEGGGLECIELVEAHRPRSRPKAASASAVAAFSQRHGR